MATIVENMHGRRIIKISTDDIISIVREYQIAVCSSESYRETEHLYIFVIVQEALIVIIVVVITAITAIIVVVVIVIAAVIVVA